MDSSKWQKLAGVAMAAGLLVLAQYFPNVADGLTLLAGSVGTLVGVSLRRAPVTTNITR